MQATTVNFLRCFFCNSPEKLGYKSSRGLHLKFTTAENERLEEMFRKSGAKGMNIQICEDCLLERVVDPNHPKKVEH